MTEGTNAAGFYYDYGSFDGGLGRHRHRTAPRWAGRASPAVHLQVGRQHVPRPFLRATIRTATCSRATSTRRRRRGRRPAAASQPTDLNRMVTLLRPQRRRRRLHEEGRDVVVRLGARSADRQSRYPNFPVKPFVTRLHQLSPARAPTRSARTTSSSATGSGAGSSSRTGSTTTRPRRPRPSTRAPTPPGTSSTGATCGRASGTRCSATRRSSSSATASSATSGRTIATPNTPSYQDLTTNQVRGAQPRLAAGHHARSVPRLGSFFKDGWVGSHNFKFGGEVFREVITQYRGNNSGDGTCSPGTCCTSCATARQSQVILFAGDHQINQRPVDLCRLRQRHVAAGQPTDVQPRHCDSSATAASSRRRSASASTFFPEALSYDSKDDVFTWNLLSPRVGVNYDLTGDGKTLAQVQLRPVLVEPGHRACRQRQREPGRRVPSVRVDRSERRRRVAARRTGRAPRHRGRPRLGFDRSRSQGHLHARVRGVGRSRAAAELRRAHAASSIAVSISSPDLQPQSAL